MLDSQIFDNCPTDTQFTQQSFKIDPYGTIVNTYPPMGADRGGLGNYRAFKTESFPRGFNYIGRNINVLERAAKQLSLRLKKPNR